MQCNGINDCVWCLWSVCVPWQFQSKWLIILAWSSFLGEILMVTVCGFYSIQSDVNYNRGVRPFLMAINNSWLINSCVVWIIVHGLLIIFIHNSSIAFLIDRVLFYFRNVVFELKHRKSLHSAPAGLHTQVKIHHSKYVHLCTCTYMHACVKRIDSFADLA